MVNSGKFVVNIGKQWLEFLDANTEFTKGKLRMESVPHSRSPRLPPFALVYLSARVVATLATPFMREGKRAVAASDCVGQTPVAISLW